MTTGASWSTHSAGATDSIGLAVAGEKGRGVAAVSAVFAVAELAVDEVCRYEAADAWTAAACTAAAACGESRASDNI